MKLDSNSISARLYKWFFITEDLPTNLCPYFWKLVLMYVFIIPYYIISIPKIILDSVLKTESNDNIERFGGGIMIYFIMCCVVGVGFFISSAWITFYEPNWEYFFFALGATTAATVVFFSVLGLLFYIFEVRANEKKPNIIIEFTKAKYNKYCPKIEWNEN